MLIVPVNDVPSQTFSVVLGGQSCQIRIVQRGQALYADVSVNNTPIVQGSACRDRVFIVRSAYLGFIGDLLFIDMQGTSNPLSPGLGTRYLFVYAEASDLSAS